MDVLGHSPRAICSPHETTGEEGDDEKASVDSLIDRTCETELVAEPVDVEEGSRQLMEQKNRAVEVNEWSLPTLSVSEYTRA